MSLTPRQFIEACENNTAAVSLVESWIEAALSRLEDKPAKSADVSLEVLKAADDFAKRNDLELHVYDRKVT